MVTVDVDGSRLKVDSQPNSVGFVQKQHSSYKLVNCSSDFGHYDSITNTDIIIIIIFFYYYHY